MDRTAGPQSENLPAPPTEETVRVLADLAGLRLEPDRMPVVAAHLADLLAFAAEVRGVDVDGLDPEVAFDPSWPETDA